MIGVYKITNPSGKVYIGQSIDTDKRIKNYKYGYCKKQRRLYNSFKKHGYENHVFEVIQECSVSELNDLERYWQEYYNVICKNGLNCELTTAKNVRRELSEESKKIIGLKNRGVNNGMYGVKHSEEFKKERRNYRHTAEVKKIISHHSKRGNSPTAKIVLCLSTGIYYGCIGDAADSLNVPYDRLKQWLNGRRKNKSNMIFA